KLGFSEEELRALLEKLEPGVQPDEDSAPEPPETPVSKAGDLWVLGKHRLLCGDATNDASYQALLAGEVSNLVFTDPPYNVAYRAPGLGVEIANDDLGKSFPAFLEAACRRMLEHTCGAVYVAMSSSELHTLYSAFTSAGGHW